jgi:hypothetical protein
MFKDSQNHTNDFQSKIKCFRCSQFGHFARDCTQKDCIILIIEKENFVEKNNIAQTEIMIIERESIVVEIGGREEKIVKKESQLRIQIENVEKVLAVHLVLNHLQVFDFR